MATISMVIPGINVEVALFSRSLNMTHMNKQPELGDKKAPEMERSENAASKARAEAGSDMGSISEKVKQQRQQQHDSGQSGVTGKKGDKNGFRSAKDILGEHAHTPLSKIAEDKRDAAFRKQYGDPNAAQSCQFVESKAKLQEIDAPTKQTIATNSQEFLEKLKLNNLEPRYQTESQRQSLITESNKLKAEIRELAKKYDQEAKQLDRNHEASIAKVSESEYQSQKRVFQITEKFEKRKAEFFAHMSRAFETTQHGKLKPELPLKDFSISDKQSQSFKDTQKTLAGLKGKVAEADYLKLQSELNGLETIELQWTLANQDWRHKHGERVTLVESINKEEQEHLHPLSERMAEKRKSLDKIEEKLQENRQTDDLNCIDKLARNQQEQCTSPSQSWSKHR